MAAEQPPSERQLEISYREACRNYTGGFALAVFMATTFFGLWLEGTTLAEHTARAMLVSLTLLGSGIVVAWKYRPVWFYELIEGPYDEDEEVGGSE